MIRNFSAGLKKKSMAKIIVGTDPIQVLRPNPKRTGFEIVFLPVAIIATNTGLIFHKTGAPPSKTVAGENYDGVLTDGSVQPRFLANGDSKHAVKSEQWLISDTANQVVTVLEFLEENET